jgi:hypothetical protein
MIWLFNFNFFFMSAVIPSESDGTQDIPDLAQNMTGLLRLMSQKWNNIPTFWDFAPDRQKAEDAAQAFFAEHPDWVFIFRWFFDATAGSVYFWTQNSRARYAYTRWDFYMTQWGQEEFYARIFQSWVEQGSVRISGAPSQLTTDMAGRVSRLLERWLASLGSVQDVSEEF